MDKDYYRDKIMDILSDITFHDESGGFADGKN